MQYIVYDMFAHLCFADTEGQPMISTPWREFTAPEPLAFQLVGGAPGAQAGVRIRDHTACFGHADEGWVCISRDDCQTFGAVFLYDFGRLRNVDRADATLLLHPFGLVHLYAARFVNGDVVTRFVLGSSELDTEMRQLVQGTRLNEFTDIPAITLVLGTQFDLQVQ